MHPLPSPIDTLEQMLREEEPNLLRLYLNPHVAQTCFCLDRYVRTTWTRPRATASGAGLEAEECQSFVANSFEEALGGAIKLVRYSRGENGAGRIGLVLDTADCLSGFADAQLAGGDRVEFLPSLRVIGGRELRGGSDWLRQLEAPGVLIDPLVLVAKSDGQLDEQAEAIRRLVLRHNPAIITCVDRYSLASIRGGSPGILRELTPDVIVFDESFVGRAVPFAAFTARRSLFAAWNRPGKSTFHSTTFQPNTITTRHFMNVLAMTDPDFCQKYAEELRAIACNLVRRGDAFRRYYQPSLYRLIRAAGFDTSDLRASGAFVVVDGQPILDFVGGVACSVRGHNPPTYADELRSKSARGVDNSSLEAELGGRLRELTGLGHVLPAVSGANAVENALRLALVARFPRRHVLALKAGFGGKTLFALTGTANPSYKKHVGPLYADVHYVDPFAPGARDQIDMLFREHEFAVVQVELIQSVGGVRRIPQALVCHLAERRQRWGYLLIVDEIQTGMYRTGPFLQSQTFGLTPDFLLLGKGTSDMMFPFSLTLYSDAVAALLADRGSSLIDAIRHRYGYELGYKTVLNVLKSAESLGLSEHVADAGAQFERLLNEGLGPLEIVREVRVFGLLIAIELEASSWPRRWLRRRLSAPYLLAMLHHEVFPVMAGFCQYEPNTLKITPPLNVCPDEIVQSCKTMTDVLSRPLSRVLPVALGRMLKPFPIRKGKP